MGRIMALDVGDVRIGIAVSDLLKMIARPLETRKVVGIEQDINYIADLVKTQEVELVIIGLPLKLDGTDSLQTTKTRAFATQLEAVISVPIKFVDERLTSVEAENLLIEADVRRDKRKGVIDQIAAAIILRSYLN